MPVIGNSGYVPPPFLGNGHVQTVYPPLFRRVRGPAYRRERLETPDGDFLDLDWSRAGAGRAAILCHGLEGDAAAVYMRGMVLALNRRGWDAAALNFRGCSGETNRLPRSYHSGATDDLETAVERVLDRGYADVALVGFSLGGNVVLKYLGESRRPAAVRSGAAVSVPCDLAASAGRIGEPSNRLYLERFMISLKRKLRAKRRQLEGVIDLEAALAARDFREFDERCTAPLNGFAGAEDYWARCSARRFLGGIRVPTLILSARNDPLLAPECFPWREAEAGSLLFLEVPSGGGHVGFVTFGRAGEYWHERRVADFLDRPPGA